MITQETLKGKKLTDLRIWGQNLGFVCYCLDIDQSLTVVKAVHEYRSSAGYWDCSGIGCDACSPSFRWYPTGGVEHKVFPPLEQPPAKCWFGLNTDSPYCEEVEMDGIGFEVGENWVITKVWLFEPGG